MDFQNQSDLQVQKIMDKKVFNGKTLYLVKWQNYPLEEATWECNKILSNVKDKIREFKYSKRASEDLPNIKIEEDMPEGEVRDTFKRKRGRPPRMSFNSYRQVANQPDKKSIDIPKNTGLNQKRKRGRPRGSKNKRPRQIHFEEQSSISFDSEEFNNQKEMDKTLTNSDLQGNTIQQKGDKKLKKLKKIKDKQKQKMGDGKTDTERFSQEEFDIVDSEQEESKEKGVNFNSGQKIICENISIDKRLSIFYLQQSQQCQAKHQDNQKTIKAKQKGINGSSQNKKEKHQISISENIQRGLEKEYLQLDQLNSNKKERRIKLKQGSSKLSKNVQKNTEQINQIKLNQTNLIEQGSQKQNQTKSNEKLLEGKKNEDNADNLNMKNKLQLSIKEKNDEVKTTSKNYNQASQNLLSSIESKSKVNQNFEIQKKKKEDQIQQLFMNSKRSEQNQGEIVKRYDQDKISKIYYLETIELPSVDSDFSNEFFQPFRHDCFSLQNLQRLSRIKSIVDQQIHPLRSNRKPAPNLNLFEVQNDKTAQRNASQQNGLQFFQLICSFIKANPSYQNQQIVGLIIEYFTANRPSLNNFDIHRKQNQGIQIISLESLYLVEFNQGNHIKKLTSSELLLYMIIDSIKTLQDQCLIQYLSLSLHNFTFYIKFLQNLTTKHQLKNQQTLKIEKPQSKNIKMENKTHNEKQELQVLLLQAMKSIKSKKRFSRFKSSTKKKNQSNTPQESNEKKLMKVIPENFRLKQNEGNCLISNEKEVQVPKQEESSQEEKITEPDKHQH